MDTRSNLEPSNRLKIQEPPRSEPDIWTKLTGADDFRNMDSVKLLELLGVSAAELLGTAIFVGVGCSSVVSCLDGTDGHVNHVIITFSFSLAITLVVTLFAHISGCHVNPAVSLSAMIFGHLSLPRFLLYVVSQCLGSILGTAVLKGLSPEGCTEGPFCVTLPHPQVGDVKAMLIEATLTGILVGVCAALWDRRCQDKHDSLSIKLGLVVAALVFPGGKFTGCSMNPARSLGPALLSGHWQHHWVYWVGPIGGSVVATVIYKTLFSETKARKVISHHAQSQDNLPL